MPDNLYIVLSKLAKRTPNRCAVVDRASGVRLSYAQLQRRVDALAIAWQGLGVDEGARVLWLGQNSFRVLESLLCCAKLGAIFCPVNWRQSAQELAFVFDDVEPALLLWQAQEIGERLYPVLVKAQEKAIPCWQHDGLSGAWPAEHVIDCTLVLGEPQSDYEMLLASASVASQAPVLPSDQDAVLMLYTAAFSGKPNGAVISHRAIVHQSQTYSNIKGIDAQACYLNVGPLFHVATLMETLATFYVGACNVFIRRADAEEICKAVAQEQCNSAFLLPPIIEQIIALSKQQAVSLKSLNMLAGSQEWDALVSVDDSRWGSSPYGYGQTETFAYATYSAIGDKNIGNMGCVQPGVQICILDESGVKLSVGQVGEIAVRGPTVLLSYWNRPELNAQRSSDGWHRCNDLGALESDGSLRFIGPKGRMIRSGQENIYPVEVEQCLNKHVAVLQSVVVAIPDDRWDQRVLAVVVLEEGQQCDAQTLIAFCKEHIASYKKPKDIVFVAELPTSNGVIDVEKVDALYGGAQHVIS